MPSPVAAISAAVRIIADATIHGVAAAGRSLDHCYFLTYAYNIRE